MRMIPVLLLSLVMLLSLPARAATVDELIAKAGSQNLSADECNQLSQAMKDAANAGKWLQVATALKANWGRSSLTGWGQIGLIAPAIAGLSADQKAQMAAALYELYAVKGGPLKQLDSGQARELYVLLCGLGSVQPAADLLAGWTSDSDVWKSAANGWQLADLALALSYGRSDQARKAQADVAAKFVETSFGANVTPLPLADAIDLSIRAFPGLPSEQRKQVTEVLLPRAGEADALANRGTLLTQLSILVRDSTRRPGDEVVKAFAKVLVKGLKDGMPLPDRSYCFQLAFAFTAPESQQLLRAELVDGSGLVRQDIADVLTYAYKFLKQHQEWIAFLDSKINDAAVTGDAKASWLVAKALAVEVADVHINGRSPAQTVLSQFNVLKAALAAAESTSMKLLVFSRLADHFCAQARPELAVSALESVKEQFSGADRTKLDQLLATMTQRQQQAEQQKPVTEAAVRESQKQSRLQYYRWQLQIAQKKGDAAASEKIQQAIANLEKSN